MQPFLLSSGTPLVFWIILLLIAFFFLCWLAMQGSFHPFWSLSQRMGHALLLCPYFRDLLTAWKSLILLVAHFSFFLVGFPVFRVGLFEVKHTCGGFFGLCCPCGGLNWSTLRSLSQSSDSIVRFRTRSRSSLRTQTSCHSVGSGCLGSWSQAPSLLCCSISSVTGAWL